jgi:ribulose-phosphate 3-epimerase
MIIPGILENTLPEIEKKVKAISNAADLIQIDVADGILVDGITFLELEKLAAIKADVSFELHLMVQNPHKYVVRLNNVTNYLSQVEADHVEDYIKKSYEIGYKTGLSISPDTPNQEVEKYIDQIDYVQFMGVVPGAQNRPFEPKVMEKIKEFKLAHPEFEVQVDGHMNAETIEVLKGLDVNHFVVGSDIFNDVNPVNKFKELSENVRNN